MPKEYSPDEIKTVLDKDTERMLKAYIPKVIKEEVREELKEFNRQAPRCKNCTVNCGYKDILLDKDSESTCIVPFRRRVAMSDNSKISILDDMTIQAYAEEIIDLLLKNLRDNPRIASAQALMSKLIDYKKAFHPAVHKQMTINVDTFNKELQRWRESRAEKIITFNNGKRS